MSQCRQSFRSGAWLRDPHPLVVILVLPVLSSLTRSCLCRIRPVGGVNVVRSNNNRNSCNNCNDHSSHPTHSHIGLTSHSQIHKRFTPGTEPRAVNSYHNHSHNSPPSCHNPPINQSNNTHHFIKQSNKRRLPMKVHHSAILLAVLGTVTRSHAENGLRGPQRGASVAADVPNQNSVPTSIDRARFLAAPVGVVASYAATCPDT